jgi:glycosyltransferase involved in cell wall biosynthesis
MLNHADLAALLSTCDVFCLPTRYSEGLPTSLLEAAACSCALVSSHAGGVDEIIPTQDHGVILKHAEATDLVRALMMLTEDPDRLRMLQQTAREFVSEQFSWDHTVSELLAAFDRAEQGW